MLPRSVGHLTHLKSLNLAENALRGALPPEIAFLRYLRTLDVSSNMLSRRAVDLLFFSSGVTSTKVQMLTHVTRRQLQHAQQACFFPPSPLDLPVQKCKC